MGGGGSSVSGMGTVYCVEVGDIEVAVAGDVEAAGDIDLADVEDKADR